MTLPLALIIEDDPHQALFYAKALKAAGFETESFQDGDAALVRLAVLTPDLVVLDLYLPQASGKKVLSEIRGDRRLAKTHVILATAEANQANEIASQADLVLLKPISFDQLRDLAQQLYLYG